MNESSASEMPQRKRNNIPDLPRAMSMKVSVKDGEICNQKTMRERLERFGEVGNADDTNGFGLDFVEETHLAIQRICDSQLRLDGTER